MSNAVRKFVDRVTSSRAGHGKTDTGSNSNVSDGSSSGSSVASVRRVGAKAKAHSSTESLVKSDSTHTTSGQRKRQPAGAPPMSMDVPEATPQPTDDRHVVLNELRALMMEMKDQMRADIKDSFAELILPLERKFESLDAKFKSQERAINSLTKDHKLLMDRLALVQAGADKGASEARSAIKHLEKNVTEKLATASTAPIQGTTCPTQNEVSDLVRDAYLREEKRNNVIIRGIDVTGTPDMKKVVSTIVPNMSESDVLSVTVIVPRKKSPGTEDSTTTTPASSSSAEKDVPTPPTTTSASARLLRVKLTPEGKGHMLHHKVKASYNGNPVFINHDLTKQQQENQRKVLPLFKELRQKGHRCHLPRDKIIFDGKELNDAAIAAMLST